MSYTHLLSALIILNENPSPCGEQLRAGSGALRLLWLYPVFAFTGRVKVVRNNKHSPPFSHPVTPHFNCLHQPLQHFQHQTSPLSRSSSPMEDLSSHLIWFHFIPVRPDFTPSFLVEKLIFREMSIKSQSPSPASTGREEVLVMKSTPSSVWSNV